MPSETRKSGGDDVFRFKKGDLVKFTKKPFLGIFYVKDIGITEVLLQNQAGFVEVFSVKDIELVKFPIRINDD